MSTPPGSRVLVSDRDTGDGQRALPLLDLNENLPAYEEIAALNARAAATAERHRTLLEINNAIVSNLTQKELFQAITQALRRVVSFERAMIFLHDPDRDALKLFVLESSLPSSHLVIGWEEASRSSPVGWVFQHRQPLLRCNVEKEREYPADDLSSADGIRSYAIVPLIAGGRAVGTLSVGSSQAGEYKESDVAFLQEVAGQVALAVENMNVFGALAQEVALRRRVEGMLRTITEGTAAVTGNEFFRSLVRHLASGLRVRCALVTECLDQPRRRVRPLAVWRGDDLGETGEYDVALTPCEEVLAGSVRHWRGNLPRVYPAHGEVFGFEAESYLGVPLHSSSGQVIGHLAILDDKPMDEDEQAIAVLKIFAARAGAELERKRVEDTLREMHQFNQDIINGATEGIIVYDSDLRYVVFNRFMEQLTGRKAEDVLGRYAPEAFPFLQQTGIEALLRRALQGELVTSPDIRIQMPTGQAVWESNRYGPYLDAEGNIKGVIALVSDITQRKHAEEALRKALQEVERLKNRLQAENVYLQEEIRREHNFIEMVGSSPTLLATLRRVEQVAATDSTVLICGETGTGKELIARAIHSRSPRKDRPLVKVNSSAISAGLLESELFGHVKGAFTGALERRTGRFELADGGTIFLDEVGELPLEAQAKLLRVLQEGEFEPVGSSKTIRVDVRVIAATNRDLQQMVKAGTFREDLYYRLSVVELGVPPLRERREDIPRLLEHFLAEFSNGNPCVLHPEALRVLEAYSWPGNVRELANVVENLTQLHRGRELGVDTLPAKIQADVLRKALRAPESGGDSDLIADWPSLDELERRYIKILLGQHREKQRVAEILGVDRTTLYRKLKRYGFQEGGEEPAP